MDVCYQRSRFRSWLLVLVAFFVAICYSTLVLADNHDVLDKAGVINQSTQDYILQQNEDRLSNVKTKPQLAVVTVKSLNGDDLDDTAQQYFDKYKFGRKGYDNGVLLFIAVKDHKVRLQTGYGMEEVLPDSSIDDVFDDQAKADFRRDDYSAGIKRMVDLTCNKIVKNQDDIVTPAEHREQQQAMTNMSRYLLIMLQWFLFTIVVAIGSLFGLKILRQKQLEQEYEREFKNPVNHLLDLLDISDAQDSDLRYIYDHYEVSRWLVFETALLYFFNQQLDRDNRHVQNLLYGKDIASVIDSSANELLITDLTKRAVTFTAGSWSDVDCIKFFGGLTKHCELFRKNDQWLNELLTDAGWLNALYDKQCCKQFDSLELPGFYADVRDSILCSLRSTMLVGVTDHLFNSKDDLKTEIKPKLEAQLSVLLENQHVNQIFSQKLDIDRSAIRTKYAKSDAASKVEFDDCLSDYLDSLAIDDKRKMLAKGSNFVSLFVAGLAAYGLSKWHQNNFFEDRDSDDDLDDYDDNDHWFGGGSGFFDDDDDDSFFGGSGFGDSGFDGGGSFGGDGGFSGGGGGDSSW